MLNRGNSKTNRALKLKRFIVPFALICVIPFLVFIYLLTARLFMLEILYTDVGLTLLISMLISFCGFYAGYKILQNITNNVIYYAAKAKHNDQVKSEFVASVSHELKNPLSVIKMNLSNIKDGIFGSINEDQKKAIMLSQEVIDRMTNLINDLLDLHKIKAGRVDITRKLCSITNIIEKQTKEFEILASNKKIQMTKDISGTELFVWGDESKIIQVVNNLLGNAIKYTPEMGFVKLKTYSADEYVRMEVEDTAPSIPADQLDKIFDKFERLGNKAEGTGLGLSIAKDIVELHKGRIWAESQPERGNRFIVVLPRDLRAKTAGG